VLAGGVDPPRMSRKSSPPAGYEAAGEGSASPPKRSSGSDTGAMFYGGTAVAPDVPRSRSSSIPLPVVFTLPVPIESG